MPVSGQLESFTPYWGHIEVGNYMHPADIAAFNFQTGEFPQNHVLKSKFWAVYGLFRSEADYASFLETESPPPLKISGRFSVTGDAAINIATNSAYHVAASQLIDGMIRGTLTEGVDGAGVARSQMAGANGDFLFGANPFTITAP